MSLTIFQSQALVGITLSSLVGRCHPYDSVSPRPSRASDSADAETHHQHDE